VESAAAIRALLVSAVPRKSVLVLEPCHLERARAVVTAPTRANASAIKGTWAPIVPRSCALTIATTTVFAVTMELVHATKATKVLTALPMTAHKAARMASASRASASVDLAIKVLTVAQGSAHGTAVSMASVARVVFANARTVGSLVRARTAVCLSVRKTAAIMEHAMPWASAFVMPAGKVLYAPP